MFLFTASKEQGKGIVKTFIERGENSDCRVAVNAGINYENIVLDGFVRIVARSDRKNQQTGEIMTGLEELGVIRTYWVVLDFY